VLERLIDDDASLFAKAVVAADDDVDDDDDGDVDKMALPRVELRGLSSGAIDGDDGADDVVDDGERAATAAKDVKPSAPDDVVDVATVRAPFRGVCKDSIRFA
jgi:hypothetical protein